MAKRPPLLEIKHSDKIRVIETSEGLAETSIVTWEKLKAAFFEEGLDVTDIKRIARKIASGETYKAGGGASPTYEYSKVPL